MGTSVNQLREWFEYGRDVDDVTHMIVATDTFDWEDYPVYVMKGEDPREIAKSEEKVMECYSYDLDWATQAAEFRANHWEMY